MARPDDIAQGKYLVTGATGRTGSHVVRKLVEAGAQVRALVHSTPPASLPQTGVEYVQGDYQDLDSLKRAAEGIDWVIATVGAQSAFRGLDLVEKVEYQGTVNMVDAAKAQGVRHMTLITVRASDTKWSFYPVYPAKAKSEAHLQSSGVAYTIFRPGGIIDTGGAMFKGMAQRVAEGETIRIYGDADQPMVFIFLDELAEFCINAHLERRAWNRIFELGGPQSPTRREYWATVGGIVGQIAHVEYLAPDDVVALREAAEKAKDWPRAHQFAREEIAGRFDTPAPDMRLLGRLFQVKQRDLNLWLLGVLRDRK
ncbi:MAG: SDR family oxidoreductase [Chloroflexi bacterium]|nr:SDR family oxidoreductase [Chloroflexota bacterium]